MLRTAAFLTLTCLVAQASPSVEAILAQAKAAAGGAAWDRVASLESKGRVSTGGMHGTWQTWEDVLSGKSLTRYDLGVARGSEGVDGQGSWSQGKNGDVLVNEGQGARASAYLTARTYWFPSRGQGKITDEGVREGRFQVLKVHLGEALSLELWLDRTSWLLDRVVSAQDGSIKTTFFSDYRDVGGVKLPFREYVPGAERKLDTLTEYQAIKVNPVLSAGFFQRPESRLNDFGMESGAVLSKVPLDYTLDHIFIQARINGKGPYRFFLDTGGINILLPSVAKELKLPVLGSIEGGGVGEKKEAFDVIEVDRVQVGEAWMAEQTFFVVPGLEQAWAPMKFRVDGILGYELLRRFVAKVDYDAGTLTLLPAAGWAYSGGGVAVPFVFNGHHPRVQGELDGIPCALDIDTGSGATLDAYTPFAKAHGFRERAPKAVETVTGSGAGGEVKGCVIRGRQLKIGGVAMADPVVGLSMTSAGAFADSSAGGNVGQGFLHRFNLTFDYARRVIYFEKNGYYGKPEHYRTLGIRRDAKDPAIIAEVHPGTPAHRAGLKAGDRILAIDGKVIGSLPETEQRRLLNDGEPGTRVELKVRSGALERLVAMVREDTV